MLDEPLMLNSQSRAGQPHHETRRRIVRWVGATALVALADYLLVLANMKETAAGLIFLTLVVGFATRAGIATSLYVALLCAISFDFFFLPPVHTFFLAGIPEWIEMLSFIVSSLVVGQLSERARRQTRQAQQRRADVERLYELSQDMMLHEDANRLIRELPLMLRQRFDLDNVVLYVRDPDQFYSTSADVPASVQATMRTLTQGHGSSMDGPGGYQYLALMLGLTPIGALAWNPDSLSREVATPVSAQVSIALTRALAIEKFTRLEASREGERLRTALVDSLSHELRTPLTSIRAAATTLHHEDGLNAEARRDLAALIDEESDRLDKLIGEAVEMADGLCGDDDTGQTSAWYVLSALGLYPVCPGSPDYLIGSPLFDKATVDLHNGQKFVVRARSNGPQRPYIHAATLNGQSYNKVYVTHDQILAGGELVFEMVSGPDYKWAVGAESRPPQLMPEAKAAK